MANKVLLESQSLAFSYNAALGAFAHSVVSVPFTLTEWETYTIVWDGNEYERVAYAFTFADGSACIGAGNTLISTGVNNGDPFAIVLDTTHGYMHFLSLETKDTHTVGVYQAEDVQYIINGSTLTAIANSIRAKTGNDEKLSPTAMPTAIEGISGGGGGSAEGCVTVTFMDGDVVLFTRPVYIGDDCPDPVTQERITTPTKESTAQYEYPYNGWSLTKGGNADSTALTNVTEDRVVYAAFKQTARTYTITYYDEDGSTLKTDQLAYGDVPKYTPTKANVSFGYWTPTPVAVTGDASYTAVWSSVLYSGTMPSNSNITWSITNLGVLTLSGTGVLSADSQRKTPYQTYRSSVTKVVVEQGITEIGNYGLRNMDSMVELILPSSVTKIGESYACYMPTSLKTIEWGGVTYIGNDAFNDCPALIITLPEGLTYIGASAFYNAKATTSLRIPSGVTVIGSGAFSSSGLTELTFDDPNGWYVTVDGSDIDLNLSDPATNVTLINTNYKTTWKKRTT